MPAPDAPVATTPIRVGENAGTTDVLSAVGRYIVAIISAFPVILALLRGRDLSGLIDYFRGDSGSVVVAAVVGLATMGYGLYKTHKRASQVVTVAASDDVPNRIAQLK